MKALRLTLRNNYFNELILGALQYSIKAFGSANHNVNLSIGYDTSRYER
jgi:hypothetical protein